MNGELYYLVGKPNTLKQSLVSVLRKSLSDQSDIIVPEIYTTDETVAKCENYIYIDERNFLLRQSMDLYSLSWEKNESFYGVSGDLSQRIASGADVILNGSLHNLSRAKLLFPSISIVFIKKQAADEFDVEGRYLIAEHDEVKLEWDEKDFKLGQPYVLTLMSDHCMENAIEMILSLVTHNRDCLEYAG